MSDDKVVKLFPDKQTAWVCRKCTHTAWHLMKDGQVVCAGCGEASPGLVWGFHPTVIQLVKPPENSNGPTLR